MSLFNLDIRTVIALLATGNLVVLVILFSFGFNRLQGGLFRYFIYGKLLQACAWPLLGLRGSIPDLYSAYIGNTLLITAFALETFSLTAAAVPERQWRSVYAVISVSGIAAFWIFGHTPNLWVALASLTVFTLYLTASGVLIVMSGGSLLRISLGVMCFLLCIALGFRSWFGFFSHAEFALMTKNLVQTSSFMALFLLMLVGGTGFLLMLKEKNDILLSESEEQYRTLVEKADEAIVIVQDNNFVFANSRMSVMLGIPNETLMKIPVIDILHSEDREMVKRNYERRLKGENLHNVYDFRLVGEGGKLVWVSNSSTRIQWKGRPASLSLLTDISYRKQMEEERERIISDLQKALAEVKTLSGLLPICSSCKKVRDDSGYWNQIEEYVRAHTEAEFSHSLCPDCVKKLYPEIYKKIQ